MRLIKRMNLFIMVFLVIGLTIFGISFAGADDLENAPAADISMTGNTTLAESAIAKDAQVAASPGADDTADDTLLTANATLNASSSARNRSTQSYEQQARVVIPAVTSFSDSTSSRKYVYAGGQDREKRAVLGS